MALVSNPKLQVEGWDRIKWSPGASWPNSPSSQLRSSGFCLRIHPKKARWVYVCGSGTSVVRWCQGREVDVMCVCAVVVPALGSDLVLVLKAVSTRGNSC